MKDRKKAAAAKQPTRPAPGPKHVNLAAADEHGIREQLHIHVTRDGREAGVFVAQADEDGTLRTYPVPEPAPPVQTPGSLSEGIRRR